MIDADRLTALEILVSAVSGHRWRLDWTEHREPVIAVEFADGHAEQLRITREAAPAGTADVEFIANSRSDLERLVDCIRGRTRLTTDELDVIEQRADAASPGPWRVFLEAEGGIGGSNVITVSDGDDEPDLYIWRGEDLAPDAEFELIAAARNEIPELLDHVRKDHR
jgi:hypothetical protein